jgi:hypothetical protein
MSKDSIDLDDARLERRWMTQLGDAMDRLHRRRPNGADESAREQERRVRGLSPQMTVGLGVNELCVAISDIQHGLARIDSAEARDAYAYMTTLRGYALTVLANIIAPPQGE